MNALRFVGCLFLIVLCLFMVSADRASWAAEETSSIRSVVSALVDRAKLDRGVCAVLGKDDQLAIELADQSELLIYVRDSDANKVEALRKQADEAGFGIGRVVVEQGGFERLPFADQVVDVVLITNASADLLKTLDSNEVLRVLRPEGIAIVGKRINSEGADLSAKQLDAWIAKATGDKSAQTTTDEFGTWLQSTRAPLKGAGDWSHWEKSPDNNPVSDDLVIKAPYMTQFMARPYYIGMPSITTAAGGRTFLAVGHIAHHRREWDGLNKIIARNGYNGTVLWERKLSEGYLVHRSAFIATKDVFHMIAGEQCLKLDAKTGREIGEIRIPELKGEWKWMAMKDDILYVLAGQPEKGVTTTKGDRTFGGWSWADLSKEYYGRRIPVGFGDTLAAYELKKQERLWLHKEESLIDSRGMAIRDDKVYLYCPDRHMRCLDATSGEVRWTNGEQKLFNLIEEPGKGLTSTPGWRTQTLVVATPKALIIQGQTRMNVVAVSAEEGYLLWTKRKITNNPNAIYVDGNVVLGVGEGGTHVVIDPVSGDVKEDLKFRKTACTRLTACSDSFFVRGEGTLRFDRKTKKVLIDGAQRPACNDGAMPANGLLYLGPWQCDCNLSLIGNIAKCSAGDFQFDITATNEDRLQQADDFDKVALLEVNENDWPTYRGNNHRSSGMNSNAPQNVENKWIVSIGETNTPTAPVAAGDMVFVGGEDGKVRAIKASDGGVKWEYATAAPIKYPPTIWKGRAFFGSGDGCAYCVEAATGRLLWKFRAAPVDRHIMVYDYLTSTWPVASGVLVEDGVAYFAAGMVDHDGTYVYAVNAETGQLKWQNNSSGHLNAELRKGVSVQGNLSILGNQLILAGGNQVSPAQFDIESGKCLTPSFDNGRPKANNGRFVGVLHDQSVIVGGRVLYSAAENVSTKGSFAVFSKKNAFQLHYGGVPPAWNDDVTAIVNFKHGKLTCFESPKVVDRVNKGLDVENVGRDNRRWMNLYSQLERDKAIRWQSDLNGASEFEAVSMAVCPNAVVAVVKYQNRTRAHAQWYVVALDAKSGAPYFQHELQDVPLPDGLLVDAQGRIIVTTISGDVVCLGTKG